MIDRPRLVDACAWLAWLSWETRRSMRALGRRIGAAGALVAASLAVGVVAWSVEGRQTAEARQTLSRLFEQSSAPVPRVLAAADGSRQRIELFDEQLLPHADIPTAVQDLFNLAEDEQLVIARGDYRPQLDVEGGFMRYRMSLPIKGKPRAVLRFVHQALRRQKSLALESVQFKREQAGAAEVEARLQWVLLVSAPRPGPGVAR